MTGPLRTSAPSGVLHELAALGSGVVVHTEPDVTDAYRRDQASPFLVPAGTPLAVVVPRRTQDVARIVSVAARHRVPVVPRGAGSGLSGGANAVDGGIVLDLSKLRRITDLDPASMTAVAEPGVLNADLKAAAAEHGLWYAPDPASAAFSTLGGNVATNAGGLCCVKYGVTREAVLGLDVVTADGREHHLGRATRKGVVGYDLPALFAGSEGTLGVITSVTVRLVPKPPPPVTVVAAFTDLTRAGEAVAAAVRRTTPSLLEIMDGVTLAAVEAFRPQGLDPTYAALLIAQSDLGGEAGQEQAKAIEAMAVAAGADLSMVSDDAAESELLLAARRLAYPALETQGQTVLDDVAVPVGRIPDLLRKVPAIADRHGVTIGTFGHAGDGNMHPTIVVPHGDAAAAERAAHAFDAVVELAQSLGGTATGEHGVGLVKFGHGTRELGDTLDLHRRIRATLDPHGLFNPGKAV
ncbi:FAD-binding oxidoreductase [Streptomyces sp. NPDC091217]|uniref:FAD-binding oxidoreductase n=1 Tax=Streptomyces sp. NPDC091217 TaxID=3365975 RepID=UPI00382924E5